MNLTRFRVIAVFAGAALALGCGKRGERAQAVNVAAVPSTPIEEIIRDRNLTPEEAAAALKVFVPPGRYDDFVMVTSGGHRGSVMLYGIPSMRLLKEIPVYSADSWQG